MRFNVLLNILCLTSIYTSSSNQSDEENETPMEIWSMICEWAPVTVLQNLAHTSRIIGAEARRAALGRFSRLIPGTTEITFDLTKILKSLEQGIDDKDYAYFEGYIRKQCLRMSPHFPSPTDLFLNHFSVYNLLSTNEGNTGLVYYARHNHIENGSPLLKYLIQKGSCLDIVERLLLEHPDWVDHDLFWKLLELKDDKSIIQCAVSKFISHQEIETNIFKVTFSIHYELKSFDEITEDFLSIQTVPVKFLIYMLKMNKIEILIAVLASRNDVLLDDSSTTVEFLDVCFKMEDEGLSVLKYLAINPQNEKYTNIFLSATCPEDEKFIPVYLNICHRNSVEPTSSLNSKMTFYDSENKIITLSLGLHKVAKHIASCSKIYSEADFEQIGRHLMEIQMDDETFKDCCGACFLSFISHYNVEKVVAYYIDKPEFEDRLVDFVRILGCQDFHRIARLISLFGHNLKLRSLLTTKIGQFLNILTISQNYDFFYTEYLKGNSVNWNGLLEEILNNFDEDWKINAYAVDRLKVALHDQAPPSECAELVSIILRPYYVDQPNMISLGAMFIEFLKYERSDLLEIITSQSNLHERIFRSILLNNQNLDPSLMESVCIHLKGMDGAKMINIIIEECLFNPLILHHDKHFHFALAQCSGSVKFDPSDLAYNFMFTNDMIWNLIEVSNDPYHIAYQVYHSYGSLRRNEALNLALQLKYSFPDRNFIEFDVD